MGRTLRETYNAIVSDVEDEEKRGRIKVTCRDIAEVDTELPEWIEPCYPYAGVDGAAGFFFLPAVGDTVEIERVVGPTDDDAVGMAAIMDPDTHWRCATYATAGDVPTEFTSGVYGKRMGIIAPGGNMLIFDETQSAVFLVATTLIKLGSEEAAQPLVLGTILQTMLSLFLSTMETHTHGYLPGPSALAQSNPPDPATVAALQALKSSPVDDGAMLSVKVITE
jgi:hypothetical protein